MQTQISDYQKVPSAKTSSALHAQLALYRERQMKPRRASDPIRLVLVLLAHCFAWREALTIVRPAPLLRWYRRPPDSRRIASA